jgi:hypothetical protein
MKPQQITSTTSQGKNLMQGALVIALFSCCSTMTLGQSFQSGDAGEITLPADYHPGYRPTLHFIIEQDQESGTFEALPSAQARFNRQWMNQKRDMVGKQAEKELLQLGLKALYKAVYQRSKVASRYLPDEEGRLSLQSSRRYETDYSVHVRSDSLRLGMQFKF